MQMVGLEALEDPQEIAALRALIQRHVDNTGSAKGRAVLEGWAKSAPLFVKVMPKDYKRVLACVRRAHDQGLSGDEAIMAAFEENARDLARVGGN
jgi:glutamate synthase (ferredoxin)